MLGDGCDLRHAATLAGIAPATASQLAAALVRHEVLAADDPPRFLHPIVHEALEASLGSDERESLHRAAARLLHAEGAPPGRVAAHLVQLRALGDAWMLARLREAAATAVESGAPHAGAELLRRALAEPPPPGERVAVLREAGLAEARAGRESAFGLFEQALGLEADSRERGAIGLELAHAQSELFRWVDAFDVSERALADLGDADLALAARLEAVLVVCGLRDSRRAVRALPVLERLGRRRLQGGPAEAHAVARAIHALWFAGRPAVDVRAALQPAFEPARPRPEGWDLRAPGLWALICAEGFETAQTTVDAMLDEAHRFGSARGIATTYVVLGLLTFRLGALPEADAAARVAMRVMQAGDFAPGLPIGAFVLANVAIEAGQLDEARSLLGQLPADGLPAGLGSVHLPAVRGRLQLAAGRPAEALVEFDRARALMGSDAWGMEVHDNGFLNARSGAAEALLLLGDRERACELASAELAGARAFAAPRALGIALRVAGLCLGGGQGLEMLEESVASLRRSPALLERAHSLTELGAALRRAGHRAAAREPLAEALDLAAGCGARPLAARAVQELRAAGARPRREWRTGVRALTPGELRVVRLAAEGRTNREIAQTLYVTLKTVEGHLARAYGKLGITGRAELGRGLGGEKTRVPTP